MLFLVAAATCLGSLGCGAAGRNGSMPCRAVRGFAEAFGDDLQVTRVTA